MRPAGMLSLLGAITLCSLAACDGGAVSPPRQVTRPSVDRQHFRDEYGRYIFINGVNVSGTTKIPVTTNPVSYVGRPFPEDKADEWFAKMKRDGFNTVRLLTIWEAINHPGKGQFDETYLAYLRKIVEAANRQGVYVLVNFHENMFSRYFYSLFTEVPDAGWNNIPGGVGPLLGTFFPKVADDGSVSYQARITGDGAPRWAVEACAPEKNLDHPAWGVSRLLGPMTQDAFDLVTVASDITTLMGGGSGGIDLSFIDFIMTQLTTLKNAYSPFTVRDTPDVLPFTNWGLNMFFSLDSSKCYAALFAGKKAFPTYEIDGKNIQDYLQEGFAESWVQVVSRIKDLPNVIGYDMANEPPAVFYALSAMAAYIGADFDDAASRNLLVNLIGEEKGETIYHLLDAFRVLPTIPTDLAKDAMAAAYTEPISSKMTALLDPALTGLLAPLTAVECRAAGGSVCPPSAATREPVVAATQQSLRTAAGAYLNDLTTDQRTTFLTALDTLVTGAVNAAVSAAYKNLRILPLETPDLCTGPEDQSSDCVNYRLRRQEAEVQVKYEARRTAIATAVAGVATGVADVRHEMVQAYWTVEKANYGLEKFDALGSIDMNISFDANYLMPFYQRVAGEILKVQPDAIIWMEGSINLINELMGEGGIGFMSSNLTRLDGVKNLVYSPHWYPDIYPNIGFSTGPRSFVVDEWVSRSFEDGLWGRYEHVQGIMGPLPIVYGEFGSYFNFNWDLQDRDAIEQIVKNEGYPITAQILNSFYETFENHAAPRILWCMSADNDYQKGDLWNHEDFSVYGPDGEARAALAWSRPVPRFLQGEIKKTYFNSDYHWFDPDKAKPDDYFAREFFLSMESKESDQPTEIYVPQRQYETGFYVWLSDGWATYDFEDQTLFWYAAQDDPDWIHTITIRPPREGKEETHWQYFFKDGRMLKGDRN